MFIFKFEIFLTVDGEQTTEHAEALYFEVHGGALVFYNEHSVAFQAYAPDKWEFVRKLGG